MSNFLNPELFSIFNFYALRGSLWVLSPIGLYEMLEGRFRPQPYPAETATSK